jgi:UDP-glucose 4-epimerase
MFANDKIPRYNLGNAKGFSVKRVIDVAKDVSGNDFKVSIEPPCAGDPAVLVADASRAKNELHWQPEFAVLEGIVKTAWRWQTDFFF